MNVCDHEYVDKQKVSMLINIFLKEMNQISLTHVDYYAKKTMSNNL